MPELLALNVAWEARSASMATSSSGARAGRSGSSVSAPCKYQSLMI